jgi:hypothetical protein
MVERRSLVEGLHTPEPPLDPVKAQEFVFGRNRRPKPTTKRTADASPLSTRIRTDFAVALKRASLERQLNGPEPCTLRDILEEAIEPWLRSNGYLP